MEAFAPQALLLVICPNRPLCLGKDQHKEIEFYHAVNPNLAYVYGACEFLQYHGAGGVLNSVLLAIGMREGDKPDQNGCGEEPCQRYDRDTESIPLADRFAVFLNAMTSELEEMAKEAKAASEAKSAFLSKMSHEIRTPINAVLGLNEMILRESGNNNVLAYANGIGMAGNTLLGIVNDILDFSKIEAGKMEIIPVDYEMSSVLNDLVNMIQIRADDKGLRLVMDFDESIPSLLNGDEVRVKQVITNILTNAVKYTEKGSVTFRIGYECIPEDPDGIVLNVSVQDSGIGIKREDIQKLFHEFERIEEKRNRNIEGTGLGMNITKQLLDLMGTTLEVESVYGEGSKFSFRLKQRVVKWDPIGYYEKAYRIAQKAQKKYRERFIAPDASVLVVDDTPMNLLVFKSLLSCTRVRIHMADSGVEALTKDIPVIFLTGAQTAENVKHIIGLKPDAYILKSTTREVLLGYIADVFHKIGERMALQSELTTARNMAYKDPLTGAKSKQAWTQTLETMNRTIKEGRTPVFGVGVFDLNDLKKINDVRGHGAGDRYIREGCQLICDCFQHSPVFRIGGDEFAVILERTDFENRERLMAAFDRQMEENRRQGTVVVSGGIAAFEPGRDSSVQAVFERADARMYERKKQLKAMEPASGK